MTIKQMFSTAANELPEQGEIKKTSLIEVLLLRNN